METNTENKWDKEPKEKSTEGNKWKQTQDEK